MLTSIEDVPFDIHVDFSGLGRIRVSRHIWRNDGKCLSTAENEQPDAEISYADMKIHQRKKLFCALREYISSSSVL